MTPRARRPRTSRQLAADSRPVFAGAARPRYITPDYTVFDAALDRIRWLYDEFGAERIVVGSSGGKDSTAVVELALIVARERDALPLKVAWLDQECEFEATVRYQRWMADRPEIDFRWYQIPFRLSNSTNLDNPWLNVWGEGEEWVRDKEPDAIVENTFRKPDGSVVDRFGQLLSETGVEAGGIKMTGIRAEESPARRLSTTFSTSYKWLTWSVGMSSMSGQETDCYRFQPIYDWKYSDVWKAIHDNGWKYNTHYDSLYRHGISTRNMRVSNYHHESALESLTFLQEIEPQTWERATRRLAGISTYGQLGKDQYPESLPYMFKSWHEYMEHLIENLAPERSKPIFRAYYPRLLASCKGESEADICRQIVNSIIGNDLDATHVHNFEIGSDRRKYERTSRGG